jgi:TPP-dependent pyruvate/acetoin dehydrogenase alpha subunit
MSKVWDSESLIDFESEIAEIFNSGQVRAPVHLYNGNEVEILEVFKHVNKNDWVFCSWRSHYQCLLKGVPPQELKGAIIEGRSISLCFPEHRIYSSAIVGGQIPIAVGTALGIKRLGLDDRVWCFMGDMTSETGIAQTCMRYSLNHNLPITFIIEDNSLSVLTNTREVWGSDKLHYEELTLSNVISYKYRNKYPHAGAGVRVQF